ncbi:MAG: hypothetical protein ACLSGS_10685, partial [Adlercreutzia sp.]
AMGFSFALQPSYPAHHTRAASSSRKAKRTGAACLGGGMSQVKHSLASILPETAKDVRGEADAHVDQTYKCFT